MASAVEDPFAGGSLSRDPKPSTTSPSPDLVEVRKCRSDVTSRIPNVDETIQIPWLQESLDSVKILCKRVVPGWSRFSLSQLRVERISGGITNILFSVSPTSSALDDPVIVRIFGPMTEKVIDRQHEMLAVESLSKSGIGPRLIATFGNGVVQSFIRARTLSTSDMRSKEMVPFIARALSEFHVAQVSGPREPLLWGTLHKYLDTAESVRFEDARGRDAHESIDFVRLRRDVEDTEALTAELNSPVVFSHNDLLAGNIMFDESTEQVHFIDFEYSSYGYRGYDIANHFCEYAGFECDYSKYPDTEAQVLFLKNYLNPSNPDSVSESELEHVLNEVTVFRLASHLFWAVWAVIQARYSPIEFEYMEYFNLRYSEYQRLRGTSRSHSSR